MRVISGKLKGRTFEYIKSNITRPLKDSVKESIFNILTHSNEFSLKIKGANVLDLYSGVGSFGIECMSRGAEKVTFFEQDSNAHKILKQNIEKLSLWNEATIIHDKVEKIKKWIKKKKFNIFFLDPPFADKKYIETLKDIKKNKLFFNDHIIIVHREKDSKDNLEDYMKLIIDKNYGRSKVFFGKFN